MHSLLNTIDSELWRDLTKNVLSDPEQLKYYQSKVKSNQNVWSVAMKDALQKLKKEEGGE